MTVGYIFTERQALQETSLPLEVLTSLRELGKIKPDRVLSDKFVYYRKHLNLFRQIKNLLDRGFNLNDFINEIENENLDAETFVARVSAERRRETVQRPSVRRHRRQVVPDVAEVVQPTGVNPEEHPEVIRMLAMSFNELTDMANGRIPNFRRMTKKEMAIVLGHPDEAVRQQVIEEVRERTRQRYGSGSSSQRNEEVVPQPIPATVVEPSADTTPELVEEGTYFNREEIEHLNTRQLADLAKGINLKYFRRMRRTELIEALSNPDARERIQAIALERYEMYRE